MLDSTEDVNAVLSDLSEHFEIRWNEPVGFGAVRPTPITRESVFFFRRAEEAHAPGVLISCVDYEREALAFVMTLVFEELAEAANQAPLNLDFLLGGEKIGFDGFVIEYVKSESSFSYRQAEKKTKKKTANTIFSYDERYAKYPLPEFHLVSKDTNLTRHDKSSLPDAIKKHHEMPDVARALSSVIGKKKRPVAFATSGSLFKNVPPTRVWKGELQIKDNGYPITDLIEIDYLGGEEGVQRHRPLDCDCEPVLCVCPRDNNTSDLVGLLDYIREGNQIRALVLQVPGSNFLEECRYELKRIVEAGIPVVAFCSQLCANSLDSLIEMGFLPVDWGNGSAIDARHPGYCLSRAQKNATTSAAPMIPIDDNRGFSVIAAALQALRDRKTLFSEKSEEAYLKLNKILSQILKQTEVFNDTRSTMLIATAEKCIERLSEDALVSKEEEDGLARALTAIKLICASGSVLPKENAAYERISESVASGGHVQLVVDTTSSDDASRYWKEELEYNGLNASLLTVLTWREFLRQKTPEYPVDAVISGWFNRDIMSLIIQSGHAARYFLLLYKGKNCELENTWFNNFLDSRTYYEKARAEKTSRSFNKLGIEERLPDAVRDSVALRQVNSGLRHRAAVLDESPIDIVRELQLARMCRFVNDGESQDMLARPVLFEEGVVRLVRIGEGDGDRGETLPVVEEEDGQYVVNRKRAAAIEPGDVVLRLSSDEEMLSISAHESLGSKYDSALKTARLWRVPIEDLRLAGVLPEQIVERIERAGCKKTRARIRSWVTQGDVIAPQDVGDIEAILKAFGEPHDEATIARIVSAARIVRGSHIRAGRDISSATLQAFADEANELGLMRAINEFPIHQPDLGEVALMRVDYVAEPMRVPASRVGFYAEVE